jgi:DNA repair photolyase
MAYQVLGLLLERGIHVTFLTKGAIPKKHMQLLAQHASLVWAEIGLTSLDDAVLKLFEPAAARPAQRLKQIGDLVRSGVKTEVRVDPIIPGFTDSESNLRGLIAAIASCGVQSIAASSLFLRPAITTSLRKNLPPPQFNQLMSAFSPTYRMDIHTGNSSIHGMSVVSRRTIYDRVQSIAAEFGIEAKICACKNPDLAQGSCGIAGQWRPSPPLSLPQLFP